jgi:putative ABC transport system permease protein
VGGSRRAVAVEGVHDPAAADLPRPNFAAVTPRFFETFRTPLLAGRAFDSGDRTGALPVAIVSTAFASRHLPEGAVGRRIILPARDGGAEWMTIVGVASDLLAGGLDREQVDAVYRPLAQDAPMSFQVAVRSNASATGLAAPIREAVAGLDPDVALFNMRTLDEAIDLANAQYGWMSAVFLVAGALALFLAAIGLYGVMSFWVAQRTREIGVRMAVGGTRAAILVLVLGQGTTKIAVGLAAGAVLAVPVVWLLQGALLDVKSFDPLVFGGVVAVLLGAGWLGCVRPALRATRVDPMAALTAE